MIVLSAIATTIVAEAARRIFAFAMARLNGLPSRTAQVHEC